MAASRVLATSLTSGSQPLVVRGEGMWLELDDGRRVLDGTNTAAPLGHAHPEIVEAVRSAATAPAINEGVRWGGRDAAAEALLETALEGEDWAGAVRFFISAGEANDAALLARPGADRPPGARHPRARLPRRRRPRARADRAAAVARRARLPRPHRGPAPARRRPRAAGAGRRPDRRAGGGCGGRPRRPRRRRRRARRRRRGADRLQPGRHLPPARLPGPARRARVATRGRCGSPTRR